MSDNLVSESKSIEHLNTVIEHYQNSKDELTFDFIFAVSADLASRSPNGCAALLAVAVRRLIEQSKEKALST